MIFMDGGLMKSIRGVACAHLKKRSGDSLRSSVAHSLGTVPSSVVFLFDLWSYPFTCEIREKPPNGALMMHRLLMS
jgi:hypothetical protein